MGTRPELFLTVSIHFFDSPITIVVLVSAFVVVSTVLVCCSSTHGAPRALIAVYYYATQAAHGIHTQNVKTIKHKKTKIN